MFFILGYYIYFYLGLISYLIYLLQYANKVHLRYRIYLLGIKLTNKIREKIKQEKYDIIKKIFNNILVYTELIHGFAEGLSESKPLVELKKYSCIEIQTDEIPKPEPEIIIKEVIKEKIIEKVIEKPIFKERISEIKLEDSKSSKNKRSKSNSSNIEESEGNKSKKSVFIKMKKSEYDGFTESEVDFGQTKKRKKKNKNNENTSDEESTKRKNKVKVSIANRY